MVEECLKQTQAHGVAVEDIVGDYSSPTVLINGLDVVSGQSGPAEGEMSCRVDVPTKEMIAAALERSLADRV
ncbi:hypothetical protein V1517DRAFT_338200 [Lipomyces orientalis]|uniref:Uncharacterized protein n=1 Tax=Lipomyces orientalis TaxID=1233043 RepID=A0ACC3TPK0_9ASCO